MTFVIYPYYYVCDNNSVYSFLRKCGALHFRHSFASHLYEDGVDIKYIQALLGHVDPRSTEIYIHVSNKSLLGIRSPYDLHKGGEA